MRLDECQRGDLVAIVWPDGASEGGPFSDRALAGTEVLVQYGGPANSVGKKGKAIATGAFVTVCDWESMAPLADTRAFRCIVNVEILDVVESKNRGASERGLAADGDSADPLAR